MRYQPPTDAPSWLVSGSPEWYNTLGVHFSVHDALKMNQIARRLLTAAFVSVSPSVAPAAVIEATFYYTPVSMTGTPYGLTALPGELSISFSIDNYWYAQDETGPLLVKAGYDNIVLNTGVPGADAPYPVSYNQFVEFRLPDQTPAYFNLALGNVPTDERWVWFNQGFPLTAAVVGPGGLIEYDFHRADLTGFPSPPYPAPAVPLPPTAVLFATGLGIVGLAGWYRRRKAAPSRRLGQHGLAFG